MPKGENLRKSTIPLQRHLQDFDASTSSNDEFLLKISHTYNPNLNKPAQTQTTMTQQSEIDQWKQELHAYNGNVSEPTPATTKTSQKDIASIIEIIDESSTGSDDSELLAPVLSTGKRASEGTVVVPETPPSTMEVDGDGDDHDEDEDVEDKVSEQRTSVPD